jgi:peptidoglycan hydrolase-like protein with peptidoglycan-binding domain
MRSMLTATLIFVAAGASASAQMTAPSLPDIKPKPVTTIPIRPALQTPADTANAMAQAERLAIQSDLAWVGQYNGAITGEVSERMVAAIKEFQKARGGKQTGVLNPQERSVLAETAKRRQENVGWKIVTDAGTGVRLGIPTKLVPQQSSDANGAKWSSTTGTIQVQLSRRKEANPTTAKLADREKKEPAGRSIDYTVVKPDFFVLSGMQGLKKFYLRGSFKGDEVRILTILYDQATENTRSPDRRRARPSNTAPAWWSAMTAPSLPTVRSPMAASRSRLPVTAMPIGSPRTRTTIWRCCGFTARAD